MNYWSVVALFVDGIGRRENTVVICACFSYQAASFALGLRDKLDYLTHIRLQLLCRVPAGPGRKMGQKVWVKQPGESEDILPNSGNHDRALTISVSPK